MEEERKSAEEQFTEMGALGEQKIKQAMDCARAGRFAEASSLLDETIVMTIERAKECEHFGCHAAALRFQQAVIETKLTITDQWALNELGDILTNGGRRG